MNRALMLAVAAALAAVQAVGIGLTWWGGFAP